MAQGEFITVEWQDLNGQIRELERVQHEIETELDQILLECALIIEAEVKKQLKADKWVHKTADEDGEKIRDLVQTGFMRESIISYVEHQMNKRYGVVAFPAEYAEYVDDKFEFVEKAWKQVEEKVMNHFEERVEELIE